MESKIHAHFLERLLARFLDFNILTVFISLLFFVLTGDFSIDWRSGITWDIFYALYLVVTPVLWSGFIIGKRICKIRLIRTDGNSVQLSNTFFREVIGFHLIGILTLGLSLFISVFMVLFRKDKRAIHDMLGGTYVGKAYPSF
ncbi:RDD family protein [Virgibacillus salexigens]|uniref:RDD family protein n=1 Tax=Virgibacillus salexigens TaxID=61016 RepID=UPI00190CE984|nr:RDD family protein [Virgibacillus salexigens]